MKRASVLWAFAGMTLVGSCAATRRAGRASAGPLEGLEPSDAGWRALVNGDEASAARAFGARLASAPDDPLARFGRATLEYEHGQVDAALEDYLSVATIAADAAKAVERLAPPAAA